MYLFTQQLYIINRSKVAKPKLNTLETKMAKISHTKIKQPSFGEKRPKLTYTNISLFKGIVILQYIFKYERVQVKKYCIDQLRHFWFQV
jgi:hypothetical protein